MYLLEKQKQNRTIERLTLLCEIYGVCRPRGLVNYTAVHLYQKKRLVFSVLINFDFWGGGGHVQRNPLVAFRTRTDIRARWDHYSVVLQPAGWEG